MQFNIQQDQEKLEAAFRFQTNAQIDDIQLLECSSSVSETIAVSEVQIRLGLQTETGILPAPEGFARFAAHIKVVGEPVAEEQKGKQLFAVTCRYALRYSLKPGYTPTPEDLDGFKEGNAMFHCWPYFRELVQNLTARMALQIPPLPMLRLSPPAKPVPKARAAKRSTGSNRKERAEN
jgi:hypothetical protein